MPLHDRRGSFGAPAQGEQKYMSGQLQEGHPTDRLLAANVHATFSQKHYFMQHLPRRQRIMMMCNSNCDSLASENSGPIGKLRFSCMLHQLVNIITTPTRVTHTSSTSLDVILTNKRSHLHNHGTYEGGSSDHAMTFTYHHVKGTKTRPNVINRRNYKKLQ